MAKKRKSKAKTARIYYGTGANQLYWRVRVSDAKKAVTVDGTLQDAMDGKPGTTIGCHLSLCAMHNQKKFPHPVLLASFTKSAALLVDKIAGGKPIHAVRYQHRYGQLVDLNDTDASKTYVRRHPGLAERTFTLGVPHTGKRPRNGGANKKATHGEHRSVVPHGALARAKKAGLITADIR
jgi:hypothetical protein